MEGILIYIDRWLSSKKIEDMDQLEELGYFRLLLHAAKNSDCGLPKDIRLLARWSRLGKQWNKPTRDPEYRKHGITSGDKILACFSIEESGRIYNDTLLGLFRRYQRTVEKRQAAAHKSWNSPKRHQHQSGVPVTANADANAPPTEHAHADAIASDNDCKSISTRNAIRVGFEFNNSSTESESESKPTVVEIPIRPPVSLSRGALALDESHAGIAFAEWFQDYTAISKCPWNERDRQKCQRSWNAMSFEDKLAAAAHTRSQLALETWRNNFQLPYNYLLDRPWTRQITSTEEIRKKHAAAATKPVKPEPRGLRIEEIV